MIAELAEILIQEGLFEIAYRYLDLNACTSEKCERIRERIFYNNERKFGGEFERPRYRHVVHQLPRIVPRAVNKNKNVDANFGRGLKPQQQQMFNPLQSNQLNPQQTSPFKNSYPQRSPQSNYVQPTFSSEVKPNLQAAPVNKTNEANKTSNFGYSKTHPSLLSETDTKSTESSSKRIRPNKPKQAPVQPTNTNVFDPSKVSNVPPPPKQHPKQMVAEPPVYTPAPVQPQYEPYQHPVQAPTYEMTPPPYSMSHPHSAMVQPPAPVIAATKVKPPTAQMKPKAPMAAQRQPPPPPRMNTAAEVHQPSMGGLGQSQPHPPVMTPPSTAPGRGRGAPMARGRGMPPSARGGLMGSAPSEGMSHMHAPPPMPQGGAPTGMSPSSSMQMPVPPAPASMMAAPPPPKMIVRRTKPGAQ